MKPKIAGILRKTQFPLLMAFGTLPIAVMIAAPYAVDDWLRSLLPVLLYALFEIICLTLPGKTRLVAGVFGAALLLLLGWVTLPAQHRVPLGLIPIGYAILLLHGLPMAGWPQERELPFGWVVVGMLAHAAAQVMVNAARKIGFQPAMLDAVPLLTASLLIFLALAMLSLHRTSMADATMGRRALPRAVRIKNVVLTLGTLAVTVGLACIPGVARTLRRLWVLFKQGVTRLVRWLASLLPKPSAGVGGNGGGGIQDLAGLGEASEPSAILVLLERIVMVLALILLVVGAAFAVRFLFGRLRRLIHYLKNQFRQYAAMVGEDYVDEVTDTRDDGEMSRLSPLRRIRLNWGDDRRLPPDKRIRRRYLRLLLRHEEWAASQTARETLSNEAARVYERARYSGQPMTEQDAEAFERSTRRL